MELTYVYRIFGLIIAVDFWQSDLEINYVCPEETLEGLGAIIVNAEEQGLQALV